MHKIYHTHGFILSSRNVGEANKTFTLYTKEMGLIRATAQGVRLVKSKLRYSLQDFFYANIDLVKGKDIWRITSATGITSFPFIHKDRQSLVLVARIAKLLERLCDTEEPNEKIFNNLIKTLHLLDGENISPVFREAVELHSVLRIMHSLGYVGDLDLSGSYIDEEFDSGKIEPLLREKSSIIMHINKAINESQM